ncbi:TetR/AcrR family transcriptional regulator [Filimonas effusa]|uniref:TetR/AcrR family transcriptional regulator n=1 Tax=Filimonas effusa TaxID=2508721 RepID=A0A4Q1DAP2_9BACT|nr:TetR/AcrR family transcriptional regulator [Filimonas effusa]RXK86320.1 TetR/AcrR family transcriptional regulator [Filimonas effusa]
MSVNVTKEKILRVAEECFALYGFDATSTRQLAQKSGVNMSMLQYYFGCKEKLLETLLINQSELIREELSPLLAMEGSAWQRLEKMRHVIVEHAWQHRRLFKIVMQELLLHQREVIANISHQSFSETFSIMREVIADGIARKEFREGVDADLVISMVKGTLFFVLNLQMPLVPQEQEMEATKERAHAFFKSVLERYLLP